jgi:hypothetical protein
MYATRILGTSTRTKEKQMSKNDLYKTAIFAATGEVVGVKHIGDGHYKVTFQSGSTAFMPAEENGMVYLTGFVL